MRSSRAFALAVSTTAAFIMAAPAAQAAIMQAVYTGAIHDGFDNAGLFGGIDADLSGTAFTATFVYDTEIGTRYGAPGTDGVEGGTDFHAANPMVSATLAFNGGSQDFFGTAEGIAEVDGVTNGGLVGHKANTTTRFLNVFVFTGAAPSSLTTPFTGVSGGPAGYATGGSFQIGHFVLGPGGFFNLQTDAAGHFTPASVAITRVGDSPRPTTPTPEPAAWALAILGFGLAGQRLRRRAYA